MSSQQLKAIATGQAVTKPRTIFDFLSGDKKIEKAIAAVATQYLTPDRFLRLAVNAVKKTPLLMECDPQSVLGAFMTSAALGLEPNTILQQAFLIPYKKRVKQGGQWIDTYDCQFQIGARGFVTLAHRSPHIDSLQAEAIHEGDHFEHMMGSKTFLEFKKSLKNRGEAVGAFSFTRLESGVEMATVLPLDEVLKIRSKSETYNALVRRVEEAENDKDRVKAEQKLAETPWVMWFDDMAAKSAIKKQAKQLPLSPGDAMAAAVALDSDDSKVIDMATMTDPDVVRTVMKDGVDAVDQEKNTYARVEHQEGDFLEQTIQTRDHETVDYRDGDDVPARQQQQTDLPTTRQHAEPASDGVSYAQVADAIAKAKNLDDLGEAADLIKSVADSALRKELAGIYEHRREQMENPPPKQRARQQQVPSSME